MPRSACHGHSRRRRRALLAAALFVLTAPSAFASGGHSHASVPGADPDVPPPAAADAPAAGRLAPLLEGMGDLHFPISTDVPLAQRYFDQGLVLAYGFNHAEAERSFREAARRDPDCAICWWGAALVLGPNINAPMDPNDAARAWSALRTARELAARDGVAERERAYIGALAKRYAEEPPEDRSALDLALVDHRPGFAVATGLPTTTTRGGHPMPHKPDDNPAAIYRDSLSRGSYWAVHHSLETIVKLIGGADPWTYPWHRLRYRETARVRAQLVERYAPATVNKILSALRGVLKTCWRLGLMDAETHARAADVANVRAKTLPSGRAVERDEVRALFAACDDSPAGRRDAAMLAILYGGGLRRAELCGLDVADFDATGCALTVRAGKGRRDRVVYLSKPACRLVKRWLSARGGDDGPLFNPIGSTGAVRHTRLRGEAVRYILQKRQRQAGLEGITPHDFRKGYVSELLRAGVDVFTVQGLATPMR